MVHSPTIIPPGFAARALQMLQKVQQGISPVELVYMAHERWPFRPGHITHARPTLHISVLDSSFNPPTLAHLALANSLSPSSSEHGPSTPARAEPYDARMLLLSVRNADKALKPGDAKLIQRLEMMRLLSHDTCSIGAAESNGESSHTNDNVAIAVINEPTFVGKSTALLCFLRTRLTTVVESSSSLRSTSDKPDTSHTVPSPKLTFLMGFDTLVRLFSPKYYPSERVMFEMLRAFFSLDQEDCHIVCAYRQRIGSSGTFQDETLEVASEFVRSGRIAFIDLGTQEQTYSSSQVRTEVAARDEKWKQLVTHVICDYIVERGLYSGSRERGRNKGVYSESNNEE